MPVKLNIITPSEWEARAPKNEPVLVGRSSRIIFHHTAGHAQDATKEGAKEYARAIQASFSGPTGLSAATRSRGDVAR